MVVDHFKKQVYISFCNEVQIGCGNNPASYPMGARGSIYGVKTVGALN
jgi:hypothetical protein